MTTPIVRHLDHVFVPVADPAPLFNLFTDALALPVSWPITNYGTFRSGGVSFGNCTLELVSGEGEYFDPSLPAVVKGIALEPWAMERCLLDLDEHDLPHTAPVPHGTDADGPLWTTVFLGGMVGRAAIAYLCSYLGDVPMRGPAALRALREAGGGALGVQRIREVVIGAADYGKAHDRWSRLMTGHEESEPGVWRPGEGPAIKLVEAPQDGVHGFAVQVRSLAAAREALAERRLLGPVKRHSIGLHYPATYGLDVWLVE